MSREITFILEECLAQVAAGEMTVQGCLDRYPTLTDELEPLLLAAQEMWALPKPRLSPQARARVEAHLLDAAEAQFKEDNMQTSSQTSSPQKTHNTPTIFLRSWRRWPVVFSAVAALFIFALVVVVGRGVFRRPSQDVEVAQNPSPAPTLKTSIAQAPTPEPTRKPAHNVFIPALSFSYANSQWATVETARGLVQVQTDDGVWTVAGAGHRVTAGQRVRTGALSSAGIVFYDGSQVRLGPDTELSLDELDARRSDGPRVVALTQWVGEAKHEVAPAGDTRSRYEVRTPSASGVAKGTSFHVLVTPDEVARFSVDEGSVAVTGQNATVSVLAGQSTTVNAGQAPGEPAFRITGEGEVTQTGSTWVIAGQSFETHDHTVIVGNPQVGDWVFVEGRLLPDDVRLADHIVLLYRAPENRFAITGRVEAIGDAEWAVAGQAIAVNEETDVEQGVEIGDLVRVEGLIQEDGALLAQEIRLIEDAPGLPFDFVGVVQDIAAESWTISGVTVVVSATTEIDEGLEIGDKVHVRGWILEDDSWLASSIQRYEEDEAEFEFSGEVESIAPWIVSSIAFETDAQTQIGAGIEVGDRVRVQGRILEDGTWLATEIERLDEDDEYALRLVFVGTVESVEPWVIGGIPLVVNDDTLIEGDVGVGDLVRVEVEILPDGTWVVARITLLSDDEVGLGCLYVSAVVTGVSADQLELLDWPVISLEGVPVEGELEVGSVVLLHICVDADGTIHVLSVIVIYAPEPVVPPTPTSPAPPPSPPSGDDKVTICHKPNSKNPHTLTVSRSALQAHLGHGDTLGPCK